MPSFSTVNPYTSKEIKSYTYLSEKELGQKLTDSQSAFSRWKITSIAQRMEYLKSVSERIADRKEELALLITKEMGKPIKESRSELEKCIWLCNYYRDHAKNFLQPRIEDLGDKEVHHHLDPTGAVFGIMPWNFPYWQVFRYAIPNLLLGNVVLLKHAPNNTGAGLAIQDLLKEEANEAIFQTLIIDIPQVELVIAHEAVQGACVTGSMRAGSAVAELAGKYIKKSVLELGSSDPFVVLDDAPLEKAMDAAFSSRMLNAGQVCIASKQLFVPKDKLEEAKSYLLEKIENLTLGDPTDDNTDMGPLAKKEFIESLHDQMYKAEQHGAEIITGGPDGGFYRPTLMISRHDNPVNQEEVFGPVLNLIPYTDEEFLVNVLNNSRFGLSAAVWSADEQRALAFAERIETGTVAINDFVKSDPRIPFGGIKLSGYGLEMGYEGFRTFANQKVIIVNK